MNVTYRFSLESGSKKHICPSCQKRKFVFYIDNYTENFLPKQYGRCDRESKCGYHLNPYKDSYLKNFRDQESQIFSSTSLNNGTRERSTNNEIIYFDFDLFKTTLNQSFYPINAFLQNLLQNIKFPFEIKKVTQVVELYRLGTIASGYRKGAVTFPFIDVNNNIRTIQVKQFNNKNQTISTDFLHSIIEKKYRKTKTALPPWLQNYLNQEKKVSCLFGEHLLSKYPLKPVALVEAPKTAIYGALYFGLPEDHGKYIWLAVYNKSSFNYDKLKVLKGRDVYTFPDLSPNGKTYLEWQDKSRDLELKIPGTHFIFSNLLEDLASNEDKREGKDLADFLIEHDWRLYSHKENPQIELKEIRQDNLSNSVVSDESEHENRKLIKEQDNFSNSVVSDEREHENRKLIQEQNDLDEWEINSYGAMDSEEEEDWDNIISDLESFFSSIEIPQELQLCPEGFILNLHNFINTHIATVKSNNGNITYLPYLNRLNIIKAMLSNHI